MSFTKRIAAHLPDRWQAELKRLRYASQIRSGRFTTSEPEFGLLPELIGPRDWVVDVGANIGYYTKGFSDLVGAQGRVLAFEPVPATFALLSANALIFEHANVTLFNTAVSDRTSLVGMTMPKYSSSGLDAYCQAHLTSADSSQFSVLTISLDALELTQRVVLVKIDTEGHEAAVLAGMKRTLERYHPTLIVETDSAEIIADLEALGYETEKLTGSPNLLFRFKSRTAV